MVITNFENGIKLHQDDGMIVISDDFNSFHCNFDIRDLPIFIDLITEIKQEPSMSRNTDVYFKRFRYGFYGNYLDRRRIDLYLDIITNLKLIHQDLDKYIEDKNTKELLNIITKLNIEQLSLVYNVIDKKRKEKCS